MELPAAHCADWLLDWWQTWGSTKRDRFDRQRLLLSVTLPYVFMLHKPAFGQMITRKEKPRLMAPAPAGGHTKENHAWKDGTQLF